MNTFLTISIYAGFAMLLAAFLLVFIRLTKGPDVSNRIAAMDLVASIVMAFILLYSLLIKNAMYFDIVIVISLISFIGTIGISTYLKQKR
ncbi:MAG: cation:proton antiporter [Marinilabiliales bacterium]|nr:MAG: cation:proton antiporter [Marinilabiliales bacterium]